MNATLRKMPEKETSLHYLWEREMWRMLVCMQRLGFAHKILHAYWQSWFPSAFVKMLAIKNKFFGLMIE